MAQMFTKKGTEEEYKVDSDNAKSLQVIPC